MGEVNMNVDAADLYIQKLCADFDEPESPLLIEYDYDKRDQKLNDEYRFYNFCQFVNIYSTNFEKQHNLEFESI